ncbi:580_t:CDS:2 [Paraglomus brasilianum]|uniref:NADH-cytochrome b5 reductase n=1 Tax=Paraglomus brasilianum TaxID=144538 RepID=A0A9N9BY14_9GLOM|nr:580_t:CDS:2 [Paraglomus brasilianum]
MHFYIAPKHFSVTLRSSLRNLCRCQFSTATPPQSSKTSRVRQHYAAISIGAALGSSILLYNYFVSSNKPTLDPSAFTAFTLTRRVPVSHNTDIFRFDLPRPMPTDLPIISFVRVKDDSMQVARPYTPISPTSERRFIDLMVKRYENGQVSKWLHGLKVGDKVEIKGPARTFDYKENMKKNVGMIAGGSGITPMYQLINHVLSNPNDKTKMSLIYANVTEDDILLRKELDALAHAHPDRFKVYYTLDKAPKGWTQGSGHVNKEMVIENMPKTEEDVLVIVCGPPGMIRHVAGAKAKDWSQGEIGGVLKLVGYTAEQVAKL